MSTRSIMLAALALALASTACQPPAQEAGPLSEEDVAAIRNMMEQEWTRSVLAGDVDAWAGLWVEDGVLMEPNAPAIVGREAIRGYLADFLAAFSITDFSVVVDDVDGRGDLAYVRGTDTVTYTAPGMPEAIGFDGKYLIILRRQPDGAWLAAVEIYNANLPLPEEGSGT